MLGVEPAGNVVAGAEAPHMLGTEPAVDVGSEAEAPGSPGMEPAGVVAMAPHDRKMEPGGIGIVPPGSPGVDPVRAVIPHQLYPGAPGVLVPHRPLNTEHQTLYHHMLNMHAVRVKNPHT